MLKALPRFVKALRRTAYNHALKALLVEMLTMAHRLDLPLAAYKREAADLLKLNILLEADLYNERNRALEQCLAELFTSAELVEIICNPVIGHLRCDPVEYTRRWEDICYDVEEELDRRFKGVQRHMGFCFRFWQEKAALLREKYDIAWHSPAVMNPKVRFD